MGKNILKTPNLKLSNAEDYSNQKHYFNKIKAEMPLSGVSGQNNYC